MRTTVSRTRVSLHRISRKKPRVAPHRLRLSVVLLVLLVAASPVWAGRKEAKAVLPEGVTGIASKYPGDKGIEKEPDVIFVERFEILQVFQGKPHSA